MKGLDVWPPGWRPECRQLSLCYMGPVESWHRAIMSSGQVGEMLGLEVCVPVSAGAGGHL